MAIIISITLLNFFGNNLENNIRIFYRNDICNCDTLRFKEFNDSLGVPLINYFSITGSHIGIQRNPTSICFAADKYFKNIHNSDNENKFKNCVDWILNNSITEDSCLFVEYKYKWVYNMTPNWRSAMAQGMVIKTLTQAFQFTRDSIYLKKINMFLNSFQKTVNNSGITYKIDNKNWWYEEYAKKSGKQPHILNGFMYALDGLYYNYKHTKNKQSLILFNKGINALKNNLYKYDNGINNSFYDNENKITSEYYHNIHLYFLHKFYTITNEKIFLNYYKKWNNVKKDSYFVKSIKNINKTFITIILSLFTISYILIVFFSNLIKRYNK